MENKDNMPVEDSKKKSESKSKKRSFRIPSRWIAILAFIGIFGVFVGVTLAFRASGSGYSYRVPTTLTKEEMTLFVKDLSPMQKKTLSENAEQRKNLTSEIKKLLAVAKQAEKEGLTSKKDVSGELRFIEVAIIANNFDQASAKSDEPQAAPFASITEERIKQFWEAKDVEPGLFDSLGWKETTPETREKAFQEFIDAKIALAKESGQLGDDVKPSEEEIKMARDIFAKTQIAYNDALKKFQSAGTLPEAERTKWQDMEKSARLQIKLQQAQFLFQYYTQVALKKKLEVTDADVEKYLKENPEIGDKSKKLALANEILKKLEADGDFAELAKEYSEDPGSKENGGLYEKVKQGQMTPAFEKAALALEPGSYTKTPVETDFGFHIIKLEGKTETKDAEGKPSLEYSARHILISTQMSDPNNPMSRPMSAKDFVKLKLQSEREKQIMDDIMAKNTVSIPEDFEIPKVSEEEINKQLESQRPQMPPPPPAQPEPGKEQAPKEK